MSEPTPHPPTCPVCHREHCLSPSHSEEASIARYGTGIHYAEPAPRPERTVSCVRCQGSGDIYRGRRPAICPCCLGSGEPVVVAVAADGRAVRVEAA